MVIASQKSTPQTSAQTGATGSGAELDTADIDQLIESISAKVRAQIGSDSTQDSAAQSDLAYRVSIAESFSLATESSVEIALKTSPEISPKISPKTTSDTTFPVQSPVFTKRLLPVAYTDDDTFEQEDNVLEFASFAGANIQQMAAEGYFQAIAYWLNEKLVPQSVYAKVLADEVPGRLKVLVEFERAPQPDRLTNFVCDRLYRLNSNVIEGVHLIVRGLGAAKTDWEKSIRIPTAAERADRQAGSSTSPQPAVEKTAQASPAQATQPDAPTLVHESSRSQLARQAVTGQFKFFRAALVCGSAIAAFFFGSFTEFLLSDRLSVVSSQTAEEKVLPWYGQPTDATFSPDFSRATAVSFRPASRFQGRTVEAAFETVAVIPHHKVVDPTDPTITLLFGGDLSLNNFVFEDASEVDQLFSDIDLYQQADVAMVGLAEPLAYASTSLQEDFHQRTRPQAVDALQSGGIDIVGLASEGSMTYGERGLTETLINLDRQGIYRVGAGRNQQEAHRPEILEVKGQRIAYLGYNPDALKGAKAEKAGVALSSSEDRQHIVEDIRAIRSQVDWVVVNYRWGDALEASTDADLYAVPTTEGDNEPKLLASTPEDWQKSLAHEAVDAGADLVVGYHPTRIQGTEIYRDRPIAYSLGDFAFDNEAIPDQSIQRDTAALKVSLRNQQMKVEFLPLTIHDSKLQMATDEQGTAILQAIRRTSKTLEKPLRFPTVIKASPTFKPGYRTPEATPAPSELRQLAPVEPVEAPYPALIEADHNSSPRSPDPRMRESDALFMPDPVLMPEANEVESVAPDSENLEPNSTVPNSAVPDTAVPLEPWQEPFAEDSLDSLSFEESFLPDDDFDAADEPLDIRSDGAVRPGAREIDSIQSIEAAEEEASENTPEEAPEDASKEDDESVIETYAEPIVGPLSAIPDAQLGLTFESALAE